MDEATETIVTPLTARLGCRHPIISAGMGGPARSELAAAVSQAGGFGLLGMVRESPALIAREIAAVRQRTNRAFGVNLIPACTAPKLLEDELAACFDAGVPAMCFFWDVDAQAVAKAKRAGCLVLYQVGSVADAVKAEDAGADVIIVQGVEAGGHVWGRRGLSVLLPEVADAVDVPVAASGGIVDGRGLAAALALGADGIHCGTAFLASVESFAHDYHKQRLIEAGPDATVHTDLFVINWPKGAPVRVLKNSQTEAAGDKLWGYDPDQMPREIIGHDDGAPVHRHDTNSPLRRTTGDLEAMALYAGDGVARVTASLPAGEIVERIMAEAIATLRGSAAKIAPARAG
ncbi:NAD(P)H-dependent flavin oxidoreductase [Dongia sp. agr-C8]